MRPRRSRIGRGTSDLSRQHGRGGAWTLLEHMCEPIVKGDAVEHTFAWGRIWAYRRRTGRTPAGPQARR
jgi:hypothetical protein